MVSREATPLYLAILLPLVVILIIALQFFGYDIIRVILGVDPLYYIIVFPIALGLIIAVIFRDK